MTMSNFHLFTSFPEDIRRLVFEIAFDQGYPRSNYLSIVSREIYEWIQPLVYRCVVLQTLNHNDERRFLRFISMFRSAPREKAFYTNSIKVIFIDDFTFHDFARHFLPLCKYLVSLSCWPNTRSLSTPSSRKASEDALTSMLKSDVFPYLRKLSIPIPQIGQSLAFDIFNNTLSQNLTHLDLLLGSDLSWEGLMNMPCLQYLSVQPLMDTWLSSSYTEGGMQLGLLVDRIIPFLPSSLRCFLIWLPTTVIFAAAHDDTRRKLQNQDPIFASLVHGWLDSRIILASFTNVKPEFDPGIPDYFMAEAKDFVDQTILLVNGEFDPRLIWDNPAGQGGDQLFWSIERTLHKRHQATIRARHSIWHSTNGLPLDTRAAPLHTLLPNFSLFNQFPEDIRRLVFETAFEASQMNANQLALVSQETLSWVEPLIYRRIALRHASSSQRFMSFMNTISHGRNDKSVYASLIQSLSVDADALEHLGFGFLSLCRNVLSFSGSWEKLGSHLQWDQVLWSVLNGEILPQTQMLSLQDVIIPDIFTYPICQSLTHLDISLDNSASFEGVKTLSRLKHIRVDATKGLPVREGPVEASQDVREFIQSAVLNFPITLESFVFCVDSTFALAAAIMDCELRVLRGGPTIFDDIVRGGIDYRVVLSCKTSPLSNWSDQRVSQRQIDEIYDFLNQMVPYCPSLLPWDTGDSCVGDPGIEFDWLDTVKAIIRQRKNVSHSLATDVRRLIFEMAFEASQRKAKELALVSKEVNSWIEPLLYWCIKIDTLVNSQPLRALVRTFRTGSKPRDFYAAHVKIVLINDYVFEDFAAEFLPLCRNLISLSSRPNYVSRAEGMQIMRSLLQPGTFPHLRRLSLMLGQEDPPELLDIFNHPLSQNLTHLDIDLNFALNWTALKQLQHLRFFSLQPVLTMWISSDHHRGGAELRALIQDIIPHLPMRLGCFVIWITEHMMRMAAYNDAIDTLANIPPVFKDIIRGLLDKRVVMAAYHKQDAPWSRALPEYDLVQDFLSHTIVVKAPKFNRRLIWDGEGTEVFWAELRRVMRQRSTEAEEGMF
ncbi:hypothetical protein NP233_g4883 [Leucocoprinus birnbaumii]|uniref:Uncharacterized protein n=1 Tax=Leucocoprinus birnbaumii TaxID=56174 RepID=A0AAD5YWW2_9AGAR|nr:hypothetical protein NP233_g4883 [Leucocoprinus birnbaumii]